MLLGLKIINQNHDSFSKEEKSATAAKDTYLQ
jgi:hypothetical protein